MGRAAKVKATAVDIASSVQAEKAAIAEGTLDMEAHIDTLSCAVYLASLGIVIPDKTLINMRARGLGPVYYKLGNAVTYTRKEVLEWATTARVRIVPGQATGQAPLI